MDNMNHCERNFSDFMHQQINHIERLRRWLVRHQGSEITPEQATVFWCDRGYAALFRRHFETRYRYRPAYWEIYPQTDFPVPIKTDQNTLMIR
jgi:hypothetical protein